MDDFLKKLKTRVDNLEVPNHGEVNEDALWDSIQMGISEDTEDNNPKGFLSYIPLLLAILLVVGGIGFYLYDNDTNLAQHNDNTFTQQISDISPTSKTEKNKTIHSSNDKNANQEQTIPDQQILDQGNGNSLKNEKITTNEKITMQEVHSPSLDNLKTNLIQENNSNANQISNNQKENQLGFSLPSKSPLKNQENTPKSSEKIARNNSTVKQISEITSTEIFNHSIENTTKNSDQITIEKQHNNEIDIPSENLSSLNPTSKVNDETSQNDADNQKINSNQSEITLTSIPSIFDYVEIETNKESLNLDTYYVISNKKNREISLGLFVGSHLLHSNLSSKSPVDQERKNLLNAGIKPQLGYSAMAEVTVQLYKNLNLTTGIEYARSVEQFNYNTTWDTTFQNGQNPDITINQFTERIVEHYNRHAFLSVPVLLGMDFQRGKLGYGASIGIGFNFIQTQQGRSLDNNLEVIDFPATELDNLTPRPDFYLSYHFRPYINYQLNENLKIQIRPNLRFQNYGASKFFNNMKFSSVLTGLQTGVVFDLK